MLTKFPWLTLMHQPIKQDIFEEIAIRFEKKYMHGLSTLPEDHEAWRERVVFWVQIIPAICLVLDMLLNKIKLKFGHVWMCMALNVAYLFMTIFYQLIYGKPVYFENLNWFCDYNLSFLYDTDKKISLYETIEEKTIRHYSCNISDKGNQIDWDSKTKECKEIFTSYYCPPSMLRNYANYVVDTKNQQGKVEYNRFANCFLLVIIIFAVSFMFFSIFYLIHNIKLGSAKDFHKTVCH